MSWLDKITGRLTGSQDSLRSTPPDEWTVSGITFHTSGWELVASSPSSMTWTAKDATMILTRDELPPDQPPMSLTDVRNEHRAHARAHGEDVVVVEIAGLRSGEALQVIYKRRQGAGTAYRGLVEVLSGTSRFRIVSDITEGEMTGIREALVNAAGAECGEFALGGRNADGSSLVLGRQHDAYDPAFDHGALNSVSDDERLDPLLPDDPLTRTRALLRTIAASLSLSDDRAPDPGVYRDGPVTGPRRQLSSKVVRALFDAAGRHDLAEDSR